MEASGAVLLDPEVVWQPNYVPELLRPDGELPWAERPEAAQARVRRTKVAMVTSDGRALFPGSQFGGEHPAPSWAGAPPDATLLAVLSTTRLDTTGDFDLVDYVAACDRLISYVTALQNEALAALADRPVFGQCSNPDERPHDRLRAAADEVSPAMMWTPSHTDARVRGAVELVNDLPATLAAMRAGRCDPYKAKVIAEETAPLRDHPAARREVEVLALAKVERKTGPQLRAYLKKQVLRIAPEVAERRRKAARTSRRVDRPFVECDGMAAMNVYGPVEDLAAFFTALDAAARARREAARKDDSGPDAGRTLEQLRFDVLADLGWSALNAGHLGCCNPDCVGAKQRLGTRHGRAACVCITVPATTLLGLDDTPGELDGYGPVTAEVARRLAADGVWRRLLTDPVSGALLDFGTTRYRPSPQLADFVIARDRTCRFPASNTPARAAELDHTRPYRPDESGGATSADNLGPLTSRFHNARTHHGWQLNQPEPGRFVWESPTGRRYVVDPEIITPITNSPPGDREPDPADLLGEMDPPPDTPDPPGDDAALPGDVVEQPPPF
jgi:hypothetical protein